LLDVQFRERFIDEALLVGVVETAGHDLLGGERGELGDLALELGDRRLRVALDLLVRLGEHAL
jgi:hypothetical protein